MYKVTQTFTTAKKAFIIGSNVTVDFNPDRSIRVTHDNHSETFCEEDAPFIMHHLQELQSDHNLNDIIEQLKLADRYENDLDFKRESNILDFAIKNLQLHKEMIDKFL